MTRPPTIVRDTEQSRASAALAASRRAAHRRGAAVCPRCHLRPPHKTQSYCAECLREYQRERHADEKDAGAYARRFDAASPNDSNVLARPMDELVTCPVPGCGWRDQRRRLAAHRKQEHTE